MNVKRTELLKALKQCLPGIESGTAVLEGADYFIFNDGYVHSYNDVMSVSVPVKSEGLLDASIKGAVRAEEFFAIINKFNGELIEFTAEKEKWVLKSGKAQAELTLMAGDFTGRFKAIAPDKKKWQDLPPEFAQGLGVCRMANNKNAISGIFITEKEIMSSDGFQINCFNYKGPAIEENIWISDASAVELLKIGMLSHIQVNGSWVQFKTNDNMVLSVKTMQAEKWPYGKLLRVLDIHKKNDKDVSAVFPKELFDAIDRAASFYLDILDSKAVRLEISQKEIKVSAERAAGKYNEIVDWKVPPPEFKTFELFVDTNMMLFAGRRSMSFYIRESDEKGDVPRLIFVTNNSIHIMSTLSKDDIVEIKLKGKLVIERKKEKPSKEPDSEEYDEEYENEPDTGDFDDEEYEEDDD